MVPRGMPTSPLHRPHGAAWHAPLYTHTPHRPSRATSVSYLVFVAPVAIASILLGLVASLGPDWVREGPIYLVPFRSTRPTREQQEQSKAYPAGLLTILRKLRSAYAGVESTRWRTSRMVGHIGWAMMTAGWLPFMCRHLFACDPTATVVGHWTRLMPTAVVGGCILSLGIQPSDAVAVRCFAASTILLHIVLGFLCMHVMTEKIKLMNAGDLDVPTEPIMWGSFVLINFIGAEFLIRCFRYNAYCAPRVLLLEIFHSSRPNFASTGLAVVLFYLGPKIYYDPAMWQVRATYAIHPQTPTPSVHMHTSIPLHSPILRPPLAGARYAWHPLRESHLHLCPRLLQRRNPQLLPPHARLLHALLVAANAHALLRVHVPPPACRPRRDPRAGSPSPFISTPSPQISSNLPTSPLISPHLPHP